MDQVLVVANLAAPSGELLSALRERADQGPVHFTLIVPSKPETTGAPDKASAGIVSGEPEAESSLDDALAEFRDAGLEITGRIGDPEPLAAVEDATNLGSFDEVIIAGTPQRVAGLMKVDLASKARAATGLPVRFVDSTG